MGKMPNKWVAAALGFLFQPLGLLYVAQPMWAGVYFIALILILGLHQIQELSPHLMLLVSLSVTAVGAVHAFRLAGRYPADKPRPRYSRWSGWVGMVFVATPVIRVFFYEPFIAHSGSMLPTIVPRTLLVVQKWGYGHYGSYGLTLYRGPITAALHRGDIIVFDFPAKPSQQFVKRVIGLPGDKLIYRDKKLSINGKEISQGRTGDYHANFGRMPVTLTRFQENLDDNVYAVLKRDDRPWIAGEPDAFPFRDKCVYDDRGLACTVPEGYYFVMGDNRDDSRDSRYWGFVPADHIVGRVVYTLQ